MQAVLHSHSVSQNIPVNKSNNLFTHSVFEDISIISSFPYYK